MKKERGIPVDLSSKYRRQIYLVTFPLGALLSAGYMWISASQITPVNLFIASGVSILLSLLFLGIWLNPGFVYTAETVFYFSMSLYFVIYSHSNINQPDRIHLMTEAQFSDVVTGMGMWLVIMSIGAFLSLSLKQFKILVLVNFIVILFVFLTNMYLLFRADVYTFGYLYRWLNMIFALLVAILLILRIGLLQQQHASTDALTGLLNRRAMYDALSKEMHRTDRYKKPFSVVLFDLDRFKLINDTYGHNAGDQTLQEIAAIVRKQIRNIDHFSRWGGEEFLIVLIETDMQRGLQVTERIRCTIDEHRFERAEHLTGSFGVTTYTSGQSLDELLHVVDQGMYTAKNSGGNRIALPEGKVGVESP
jgi:diguanylate cyclase (GGDEF)-like protein